MRHFMGVARPSHLAGSPMLYKRVFDQRPKLDVAIANVVGPLA